MGVKQKIRRFIRGLPDRITNIRHREHLPFYRERYIKYYYVSMLNQYRNLIRDRVHRRRYKTIDYDGEFGTELKFVIPFAYWHYCNGTLLKTVSSKQSKPFYFFSPNHEEKYCARTWRPYVSGIPNTEDHNLKYILCRWKRVPFKAFYRNELFRFSKPLLVIANKYNIEWDEAPVNSLSIELLRRIFSACHERFQIIYNRPGGNHIVNDESDILHFGDRDLLRDRFPGVVDLTTLYEERYRELGVANFNEFQLLVYASCERFVSVHGGASVLASYFGGVNIIYSKKGFEHYFGEFESFYPKLSGAKVVHARTEAEVMECVAREFLGV